MAISGTMIKNSKKKAVMLAGVGEYPIMVYNYLTKNGVDIAHFIVEEPLDKKTFIRYRIKKLGLFTVLGQIAHRILIVTLLQKTSKARMQELAHIGNLDPIFPKEHKLIKIPSVNSKECADLLGQIDPAVAIVVNTRIIGKRTLSSISGKFINIHAGITPKYRGWHGGYWALVNRDKENCGITIHLVDEGIDTGGILYQGIIDATEKDNYYTYPFLQLIKGLPLLKMAVEDVLNEDVKVLPGKTKSDGLYYHPTLWTYLLNRIRKNVK